MSCPYPDEALEFWDSVSNPMGDACDECEDFDCEHNPNGGRDDYFYPDTEEL